MTHVGIGGGGSQTVQDALHLSIVSVYLLIQAQHMLVAMLLTCLVEDAQHLVEAVIDLTMQTRYLHDDARVCQTVNKRIGQTLYHLIPVVVVSLMVDIEHRLFDVPHLVPKEIDSHHRQGIGTVHVLRVGVVHAQILSEAQCLGLQPCLLQFNEYQSFRAVLLTDSSSEVDAEYRERIALAVGVLMWPHLHLDDVLSEQCRQDGAGDALVLHQVLEHDVVNRVCYNHIACCLFSLAKIVHIE